MNLGYTIAEQVILDGIDVAVAPGELLVVQGPNGAGKSTLLRLMAGILTPSSGQVMWGEVDVHRQYEAVRGKFCYVGHRLALKPSLTVRENIRFWSKVHDAGELEGAAIHYFDLEPFLDMPVRNLSAGWQRKAAMTRLILSQAKVWLLDEPTSHLDEEGIELVESLIASRKEQGGVVVMSLHGKVNSSNVKILNIND